MSADEYDARMRGPAQAGDTRSWQPTAKTAAAQFAQLRDALAATHAADPLSLVSLTVSLDSATIVNAFGSVKLAAAAMVEALDYIAPFLIESSYVRIDLRGAGRRMDFDTSMMRRGF